MTHLKKKKQVYCTKTEVLDSQSSFERDLNGHLVGVLNNAKKSIAT